MRGFISRTIPFLLLLVATATLAAPPLVGPPTTPVVSPPLRTLGAAGDIADKPHLVPNFEVPRKTAAGAATPADTVVQSALNPAHSPDVLGVNFDGVGVSNSAPPDTTGRVGRNHYVQWVNTKLAVWDKSGHLLFGPVCHICPFRRLRPIRLRCLIRVLRLVTARRRTAPGICGRAVVLLMGNRGLSTGVGAARF